MLLEDLNNPSMPIDKWGHPLDKLDAEEANWSSHLRHRSGCTCSDRNKNIYAEVTSGRQQNEVATQFGLTASRVHQIMVKVNRCKQESWRVAPHIDDYTAARYMIDVLSRMEKAAKP